MFGKAAVVGTVVKTLLKPTSPKEGPPFPESWDVSWPGFFKRAAERLQTEPPWKTIPERGLGAELKTEFEVVTGRKL